MQESSHSRHDEATIDVHVCLEVMLPQLLTSPSLIQPGLPLKAFPLMAEGPICRFLKDLRLLVFFLLRALREAAQHAIRKGSNNSDTCSKRHGDSSWHPRLIPTIPREPSSRRSDRRARIPVLRVNLPRTCIVQPRPDASAADRD